MPRPKKITAPIKSKRRSLIVWTVVIVAILLVAGASQVVRELFRTLDTVGKVEFVHQMPVPALAESTLSANGTRTFNLDLQTGVTSFFEGSQTETWGVNGAYLGPTLRAARGEKVVVNVKNNLPETTSMHWHGMHLPAKMDGGPHQSIVAGETWSPAWKIDQPAATLWYHPHPHGKTEKHVYRGVAGMFILDDNTPAAASLPRTYGVDDLPVIVQDKSFDRSKQLVLKNEGPTGMLGDTMIVNGALTPYVDVTTQRVRLRLLNASTARIYNFGLSNDAAMQLVATDGGLLEKPVPLTRVLLSPGERAEIIVTMTAGETVNLRSFPADLGAGFIANRLAGADDKLEIMQLRAADQLAPSQDIPSELAQVEYLDESTATNTRELIINSGQTINGKSMDMQRVDFSVTRGDTEIWEVTNRGGAPHNFHIHDVQFRVLSVGGQPPPPELQGRKDTIFIREGQTARLIMQFSDYSDATFPYMFHCHLLQHEDQGLMGQFVVVEPGMPSTTLPSDDHSHMQMR